MKRLDPRERIRYTRQIIIPEIGEAGQRRLKGSHVIVTGVGGLGCASTTYLTAAGVGHLTIVDFDSVQRPDLNRQVLYSEDDIGKKKVPIARRRLSKLNPHVEISSILSKITEENVLQIIHGADVVVDGLDNSAARLLINLACIKRKIPYVYGGVSRLRGMVTTIIPGKTPCLACIFPEAIPKRESLGVLGVIPALIATIQALEAIKLLIGQPPSLAGKLLRFNGNDLRLRIDDMRKRRDCTACSPEALK